MGSRRFKLAAERSCTVCSKQFSPRQQDVNQGKGRCCSVRCARVLTGLKCRKNRATEEKAFWKNVEVSNSGTCWIWSGPKNPKGYGLSRLGSRRDYAHRIAYRIATATEVPAGMFVCHVCDNASCCNPDHLFLGTVDDNNKDMVSKQRHAFGERNGCSKLINGQVAAIRTDTRPMSVIAQNYGVSRSLIGQVKSRKIWRHLP